MFVLSRGWLSDAGLDFAYVKPITIGKDLWGQIVGTFIDVAKDDRALTVVGGDSLRLITPIKYTFGVGADRTTQTMDVDLLSDFSVIDQIKGRKVTFKFEYDGRQMEYETELQKIKGDEHIVGRIYGTDLIIDYNERRLHLFNTNTMDLIKLNIGVVNDIQDLLFPE